MVTKDEAEREVMDLYDATATLVPGGWIDGTRTWTSCRTASGATGGHFRLFAQRREQALPTTPQNLMQKAQSAWADLGYRVDIENDDSLRPPRLILSNPPWLTGSGPDGLLLQFTVGRDYADFSGLSRCVPDTALVPEQEH
jgi:hypothetical protein